MRASDSRSAFTLSVVPSVHVLVARRRAANAAAATDEEEIPEPAQAIV